MTVTGSLLLGYMAGKEPDELAAILVEVLAELPIPQLEAVLDAVLVTVRRRSVNNPKASRMSPDAMSLGQIAGANVTIPRVTPEPPNPDRPNPRWERRRRVSGNGGLLGVCIGLIVLVWAVLTLVARW